MSLTGDLRQQNPDKERRRTAGIGNEPDLPLKPGRRGVPRPRVPIRRAKSPLPHTNPSTPEQAELGNLSNNVSKPGLKSKISEQAQSAKNKLTEEAKTSVLGAEEAKKLDESGSLKNYLKDAAKSTAIETGAKRVFGEDADKVLDFYKEAKEKKKKHPLRHVARKMLQKRVLGFTTMSILMPIMIMGALVFFFSYLYKPEHVKQYLIDVHLARFNLQLTRRVGQIVASEALLSAESTGRLNPIRRGGVLDLIVGYNPQSALTRMGRADGIELVTKSRRKWNLRLTNDFLGYDNLTTGRKYRLPENATKAQKLQLAKQLEQEISDIYVTKNKIWRGKLLLDIRRQLKLRLIRFDDFGRIFKDKNRTKALNIDQKRQDGAIRDPDRVVSLSQEVDDVTKDTQKDFDDGRFTSEAAEAAGEAKVPQRTRLFQRIIESFQARPWFAALRTLSIGNALLVTICLIYDAYVYNIEKVIEKRSDNYARFAYSIFNCADQQKEGDVTSKAVQACVDSLEDFEYSTEYRSGMGLPSKGEKYDMPEELYPQKALGKEPAVVKSILEAAFESGAKSGWTIDTACRAILSTIGQVLVALIDLIATIWTLGAKDIAAQGIFRSIMAVITVMVKSGTALGLQLFMTDWLMPRMVEAYSGGDNGAQEEAAAGFNKAGAGTEILGLEMDKQSGGMVLSPDEVNQYSAELNRLQHEQDSARSWYARLFDTTNVRSLAAQFFIRVPTSLGEVRTIATTAMANISPINFAREKLISYSERSQPIWAATGEGPYGVKQFSIPLDTLNKCYDDETWCPRENAKIIEPQYDTLEAKYGKCFKDKTARMIVRFDSPEYSVCFGEGSDSLRKSEIGKRFALYKKDEFMLKELTSLQNEEDDSGLGTGSGVGAAVGNFAGGPPFSQTCAPQPGSPALPAPVLADGNAPGIPIVEPIISRGNNAVINRGVRQDVAQCVQNMISDAEDAGVVLGGSGFRDLAGQLAAGQRNGCPPNWTSSSQCRVPTAPVGKSNHGWGVAIDFQNCSSRSTACYQWLSANSTNYGFQNLPSEPWHWSIDGK